MSFTDDDITAFKAEADELLDDAEKGLLQVDKGASLKDHYDAIFRAFHSIKGAAGMMNLTPLQEHMHQLETIFVEQKPKDILEKPYVDLFLRGLDATKALLGGETISFSYGVATETDQTEKTDQKPVAVSEEVKKVISRGNLVVVTNDQNVVDTFTLVMKENNIDLLIVSSALEILSAVAGVKPNAIFIDTSLMGTDNGKLLSELYKTHPDLPVVLLSQNEDKDTSLNEIKSGAYGVMQKPLDNVKLTEYTFNAIERSKLSKLVNSSINLLMYQFSDLSEFLKTQGKEDSQKEISAQITDLLEQRRSIRNWRK